MLRFVVRRLLLLVPILIGLSILVFLWIRALPGSPATALLGERATPAAVAAVREQYGLNDPLYQQYFRYLRTLAGGNLGSSVTTRRPVVDEFKDRFPATIELALAAMIFSVGVGIPLGFLAAKRYGSWIDHLSLVASLIGISIPIFFLAILLKYVFAVKLGWLPTVGRQSVLINVPHPTNFYVLDAILARDFEAWWDAVKHLVLPAVALGSIPLAIIARITRAATLDILNEDYVRTARAKGVAPSIVDRRHILRNAMLPITTIIGLQTGLLLSGAVLTETVFAWPGIGTWLVEAIEARNYPVLQSGILLIAIVFVLVNLLVDLSYGLLNPRIRVSKMSIVELEAREVQLEAPTGLWRDAWQRLKRNPGALLGFALVGIFVIVAVFAPLIAPYDPRAQDLSALEGRCCPGPSPGHIFGLDALGRDEFSRVVYGARYSLVIGVVAVTVGLSIGLVLGSIAGYVGGLVDSVVMRLMDIMLAIPGLLLAIGIVAMLGPGLVSIMIAVGVTQIPVFARLLRGSILAQRENDFVLAARAIGVPGRSILAAHILPNAISPVIVQGTLAMATAIIDVAGLGFLGLGPQDPATPEWGTMLTGTVRYLQTAPHLALIPGAAIVVSVLGFNLIGDGLREALDPKLRGRT